MTAETLYWLFSTIAQAYGAILGLIGMLTVYRFDNLHRYREACKDRGEAPMEACYLALGFSEFDAKKLSPEEMISAWHAMSKQGKTSIIKQIPEKYSLADLEITRINRSVRWSTLIRYLFSIFAAYHLLLVTGAILGVMFTKELVYHASGVCIMVICALLASSILIGCELYCLFDDKLPIFSRMILDRINQRGKK